MESLSSQLWSEFIRQRPEPDELALAYQGSRPVEDKLALFRETPFYSRLLPETQNLLTHLRTTEWLRRPQLDAFELYVYLKEVRGNPTVQTLYREIVAHGIGVVDPLSLSDEQLEHLREVRKQISAAEDALMGVEYPNYLFSLAMGTGKTVLMGLMIFYDFVLAEYHPEDDRFAKNVLVSAPDLTIIESLREIQDMDRTRVMPREYAQFLDTNLKFHYLGDNVTDLGALPESYYNVIVANVQKFILRRIGNGDSDASRLFNDVRKKEAEMRSNQRLQRLESLDNLAIFVDEAHHSFGTSLVGDLKRVRETINHLHTRTPLAGCINLTGTPFVENQMLPEVVYYYPLAQSIRDGHLKQVVFRDYANVKTVDFVRDVVREFWKRYGEERREGLLPKMAIYCSQIRELEDEFRPLLEQVLASEGIPTEKILVNHSEAEEDSVRQFRELDLPESEKQFILLVGRGTEGWNCRSLFSCVMYRRPHSRVFVLQSSMRCLRAIGDMPQTAMVCVSTENRRLLEAEIEKNLGTTLGAIESAQNRTRITVQRLRDKRVRLAREVRRVKQVEVKPPIRIVFAFDQLDLSQYAATVTERALREHDGHLALEAREGAAIYRTQRRYTLYSLVEEVARFTKLSCLEAEGLLRRSDHGLEGVLDWVNRENLLVSHLIQTILAETVACKEEPGIEWDEVDLAPNFPVDRYLSPEDESRMVTHGSPHPRSFHLDHYLFSSSEEKRLFEELIGREKDIEEIYFTGGISDAAHNEFYVEYWDTSEQRWRKYFPDFYVKLRHNGWLVIEVKAADQADHPDVLAKEEAARRLFGMLEATRYVIKTDADIRRDHLADLFASP